MEYKIVCKEIEAILRGDQSCWRDIPVEGGFLDVISKTWKETSVAIPCYDTLPAVVQGKNGWYSLGKEIRGVASPREYIVGGAPSAPPL